MEGLEIPIVAEEPRKHGHETPVSAGCANAVIYRVCEKLHELRKRQRFGRQ